MARLCRVSLVSRHSRAAAVGRAAQSYNPEHHERTKHIERRHFYIRELVERQKLIVPFVKTTENLADFFTKPLAAGDFFRLRNEIMNLPASERGGERRARFGVHMHAHGAGASHGGVS